MKKLALAAVVAAMMISGSAFAGSPYVAGEVGLAVQPSSTNVRDNVPVAGVVAGYDFGMVRLEAEYLKGPQSNNAGGRIGGVDLDLFSANVAVQPITFHGFTPFATAGVGYGLFGGSGVNTADRESPVFNVGVGTSYAVDANWSLVGEYRYLISTDNVVVQNDRSLTTWSTNLFTVGARCTF